MGKRESSGNAIAMTSVDIVIPVLNEEATLEQQARQALRYIKQNLADLGQLRLILVDNGSHDGTQEIGEKLSRDLDSLSFLRLDRRGVGLALKQAWGQSEADIVGYMDLDLATDLAHLREALTPLINDEVDVVTGSRLLPRSRVINRSMTRAFVSRVFNGLLSFYMRAHFSDGMCGFKFLQRRHLAKIRDVGAKSDGWFFATELLVCAEALKLRLLDLPVTWTDDPNSKARVGKLAVEYLKAMSALKSELKRRSNELPQV